MSRLKHKYKIGDILYSSGWGQGVHFLVLNLEPELRYPIYTLLRLETATVEEYGYNYIDDSTKLTRVA